MICKVLNQIGLDSTLKQDRRCWAVVVSTHGPLFMRCSCIALSKTPLLTGGVQPLHKEYTIKLVSSTLNLLIAILTQH